MADAGENPAPEAIWRTLVGRSTFDVIASMHDPDQRAYLSNIDFLKAIAARRDVELRKLWTLQLIVATVTLCAIFVTSDTKIDLELFGAKIQNIQLISEFLLVVVAVGTYYVLSFAQNVGLATMMMQAIFTFNGLRHWRYFVADSSISDLWAHTLEVKPMGYASGIGHKMVMLFMVLVMVVSSVALPITSALVVDIFGADFIRKNGPLSASGLISAYSMMVATTSVLYFLLSFLVPFKFRFADPELLQRRPLAPTAEAESAAAVEEGNNPA